MTLDLDVAFRATDEERAALRRHRPAPATFEEYVRFLASFPSSREELAAIPLSKGRPFRLD
jgi:hypothetical protein